MLTHRYRGYINGFHRSKRGRVALKFDRNNLPKNLQEFLTLFLLDSFTNLGPRRFNSVLPDLLLFFIFFKMKTRVDQRFFFFRPKNLFFFFSLSFEIVGRSTFTPIVTIPIVTTTVVDFVSSHEIVETRHDGCLFDMENLSLSNFLKETRNRLFPL